jgi:hypothetical protein
MEAHMAATKPSLTHEALKAIIDQAVAEARAARDTQDKAKAKESNHSKIAAAFKRAGIRLSIYEAVIVDDLAVANFRMAETARNCLFRASQISEIGIFGDPNDLNQLATFLRCDVTVLEAYRAEAAARNLEGAGLLRWFTFELPKVALL